MKEKSEIICKDDLKTPLVMSSMTEEREKAEKLQEKKKIRFVL